MGSLLQTLALCSLYIFANSASPPNIVWIVIDDLGWDDISLHGSSQIPTPNIAKLAAEGVVLQNYYTQPLCTPSRGALMTGKYPTNLGIQHDVINGGEPWGLPTTFKIMPQYLQELGYQSHIVGKWHLGSHRSDYLPTQRGFSSYFGYRLGKSDYFTHWGEETSAIKGAKKYRGLDLWSNQSPVQDCYGEYATDIFTKRAINILETHNKSQPLFLYLAHQAVHVGGDEDPLQVPKKFSDRFSSIKNDPRRHFAGMVSATDDSIGTFMDALHANGYGENTIVMFTNDNGGPANGIAGSGASNHPLRGTKYTVWEGGVRGTGVLWAPKILKPGVYKDLTHITDFLPTILTAAGIESPKDIDGIGFWQKLTTGIGPSRTELLYNIDPIWKTWAYRLGNFKLISGVSPIGFTQWYPTVESKILTRTIKCAGMNKPLCTAQNQPCLFNIATDPCEENNIYNDQPEIVKKIMDRLNHYNSTMRPTENKPKTDLANPARFNYVFMPWEDYSLGGVSRRI